MTDNNYIGNVSTVIKVIGMMFAGWILSIFAAQGLDLGVDASTLGEAIGVILGLGFGYVDAKYPNTFGFLDNKDDTQPIQPAIDDEQGAVDYDGDEYV